MRIRIHNTARRLRFSSNMAKTLYLRITAVPSRKIIFFFSILNTVFSSHNVIFSVPDPPDLHIFGPPGSTNQMYGSGSGPGFCYHQAKIVRETLLFCDFFWTFYLLSLKMYIQKVKSRKAFLKKSSLFVGVLKVNNGFGSTTNVMDPEHWIS
jgi:hypothetical protein